MADYSRALRLAERLINKKGRTGVSLVRPGSGASDPQRPWRLSSAPDVTLLTGLRAVVLSEAEARAARGQLGFAVDLRSEVEMPDSLMGTASAVAYLAATGLAGVEPKPGDLLVTGSNRFVVLQSQPLQPGNQVIMYELLLKE